MFRLHVYFQNKIMDLWQSVFRSSKTSDILILIITASFYNGAAVYGGESWLIEQHRFICELGHDRKN